MTKQKSQNTGFFIVLTLVLLVGAMIFWPFWQLLALAGVLSVLFYPLYRHILNWLKSPSWAAILATLAAFLIIFIVMWLLGYVLLLEAGSVYNNFKAGGASFDQVAIISRLPASWQVLGGRLLNEFYAWLGSFAGNALQNATALLTNILYFFLACFIVFFSLFYFLRDGLKLQDFIKRSFPLSAAHESLLIDKLIYAVNGVITGTFITALIAAGLSTVGFFMFGVPQPFLWGAFTVLAAFVPTIGTALTIIPAIIYLFLTGNSIGGIGLLVWFGIVNVIMNSYIIPKVIGRKTSLHPLLVLFSVLGGLKLFGLFGFLFGPILMAMLVSFLDIYSSELK